MRSLRAFLVLAAFFAFTLPLMPLQLLFLKTGSRYARTFPHWYHRQVCRIVGIRLNVAGDVARDEGVLLIANHVSWLDITVLSGGGAGLLRGEAGGGVVAVRELARQASALGVRRSHAAKRGG